MPAKAIRKAFREADIYISLSLLKEYRDTPVKLEEQKKITHQQLKTLLAGVAAFVTRGKLVHPTKKITICRDAADNMLLECCLAAHAGILITSDKDLLDIEHLPFDLEIMTPRQFVADY